MVGAGPYRFTRWQPGAFIEGQAFEQHVLGQPKIARVIVSFVRDTQTAAAGAMPSSIA
jgi:ABC-type transport system substrate-binding protein